MNIKIRILKELNFHGFEFLSSQVVLNFFKKFSTKLIRIILHKISLRLPITTIKITMINLHTTKNMITMSKNIC